MAYDQNTTLVFGYKYKFTSPDSSNGPYYDDRVFVGTFVDDEYGSYYDEDDHKTRYYGDRIIMVEGVETRIPPYFVAERVWD